MAFDVHFESVLRACAQWLRGGFASLQQMPRQQKPALPNASGLPKALAQQPPNPPKPAAQGAQPHSSAANPPAQAHFSAANAPAQHGAIH